MTSDHRAGIVVFRRFPISLTLLITLAISGCSPRDPGQQNNQSVTTKPGDPFQEMVNATPAEERPYLLAAKPVVDVIVARDYAGLYNHLSSHAKASSNPQQFVATVEESSTPQTDIKDMTVDQFIEWMKKMESARGVPRKLNHVNVESTDPKILSGQGEGLDRMSVMFAIGAMPKEIPNEIRRASIRAQIQSDLSEEQLKLLAQQTEMTVEEVRKQDAQEDEEDQGTYFNLKFVFVEEGGGLKVAYFEFMPPSMLD